MLTSEQIELLEMLDEYLNSQPNVFVFDYVIDLSNDCVEFILKLSLNRQFIIRIHSKDLNENTIIEIVEHVKEIVKLY